MNIESTPKSRIGITNLHNLMTYFFYNSYKQLIVNNLICFSGY